MKLSTFLILLLTSTQGLLFAQSPNLIFKNLNRASGLPVDEVNVLAQDSSGFIWIGSREGLLRYDGFGYKSYYHDPGDKATIPNNFISKIHVDESGLLWVGTLGGAVLMNDKGKVQHVFNSLNSPLLSKEADAVFDIREDKNNIWISTSDGLLQVDKKQPGIAHIKRIDLKKRFQFSTNKLGLFSIDKSGRLWLCTLHGLAIYDPNSLMLFHKDNNPEGLAILNEKTAFKSLSLDENNGTVIYSTWEPAVRKYYTGNNTINTIYSGKGSHNPNFESLINHVLKDDHGKLWIASGQGIKTIDKNNIEQVITFAPNNFFGIRSNHVKSLLQDREGSIWVGTSEGISIARPYESAVVNLSLNNSSQYPFAEEKVNQIIPVNANTNLVSTSLGIFRTDSLFIAKEHYFFGTSKYDWSWTYYRQGDSIFISTQEGNLMYNVRAQTLSKLTYPPFDKFYPIFSFTSGKDGGIWMSQYQNNFLHYDPGTKKFKVYNMPAMGEAPGIIQLSRDNDNNLWIISTAAGIFKFDEATEKFTERLTVLPVNGLLENNVLFFKDVGRELVVGYVSKGLSLYNKQTKKFRHLGKNEGLASNSVTDMVQADSQTVWISTRNGLSRLNLSNFSFENFNYGNGILQNDVQCITILPGGKIAAGTSKGLIYFDPKNLPSGKRLYAPVISGISLHGNELNVDSFSQHNPLQIFYNKNYFSVDYICPQYINNQQIEYAYKLEGFNKDWVMAGNRRFASYSNIPGGNYLFRIRARFPGGDWVEGAAGLPIVVHAAFYKTAWFYILSAALIAVVMYMIFRYRLMQVRQVEKIRSTISSDLHDEVGATLSSISIFSAMAIQNLPAGSNAKTFLQRIGDRSRDSIEKMSDIIWSINPENDSFNQMLIRMKTFVNETVEGKDIAVHWNENEMVPKLKLDMQQRKNLYLLFKEAIINAVKYADAKNISVHLTAQNKMLYLKINDDGKGFSFDLIKPGNGIKNIKHRAVLLNGSAEIESIPGKGTTVLVAFKL